LSAVIDEPVDKETAKALSLTENIIRRDLEAKDIIDACAVLYKRYGSARAVAEETGIPYARVLKHLKYDRLHVALQQKVDAGEVSMAIALKAQDAMTDDAGNLDDLEAADLADALATVTGPEREQILRAKRREPEIPVKLLMEKFWQGNEKNRQIVVTIPTGLHQDLRVYAKKLGMTQDEAAGYLITKGLEDDRQRR
jgi:ParB family chromosome partitioning protein